MSPRQIFIAVLGTGGVGRAFLSQLSTLSSCLSQSQTSPTYLSLILLARSSKILYSESFYPLSFSSWETDLQASTLPKLSLPQIAQYLGNAPEKVILVDNTSSQEVADCYPLFLKTGINIVTPNKKGFSGSYSLWEDIFSAADSPGGGLIFHESSVGAGLPVISTLKDLIDTGDEIQKIEGVFSGTLSFLFNSFAPVRGAGGRFSEEVKKAKDLGYMEPDPRDDLNGLDVARKLTILARLSGLPIESPTSFPVQSLIPKPLESVKSGDEFLARLGEYDKDIEKLKRESEAEGMVIRFIGSIDIKKKDMRVGLEKFDTSHPIAMLKGSDNIISFYTKRYGNNPLIIQGAGAGYEVTAMGVMGDLIKVLSRKC